jgi:mannosyltransferase
MGNDEVATRWAASLSLGQLAHLLRNIDVVHGAYYLLMHAWLAVGSSPAALRVPSVVAMVVAVALVAATARRLTGSGWAGLVAGLITALTPAISYYAQTARSYALVFACVAGATLVLVRALEAELAAPPGGRVTRWWLGYGALIVASGYLNELALLVLAAHAVTMLITRPGRRAVWRWAAAAAAAAVLVVPVVVASSREVGAVTWIGRPDGASLRLLLHDYLGSSAVVAALLLIAIVAALLPPLRRGGPPAWWRGGVTAMSVAAPLLVIPAAALIAESLVARPFYVDRYVLYGEAGAALLAGAGSYRIGQWLRARISWPALVAVPGLVLVLGALLLQLGPQRGERTPQSRQFDFGGPSRYVGAHARPGDGVAYLGEFFRKASLGYPADFRAVTDFALAASPRASGTFQGSDLPFPAIRSQLLRYRRIWAIGRVPAAHYPPGLIRSQSLELLQHFREAGRASFQGVTVTLWVRK